MAAGFGAVVAYLGPNSRSIGTIVPDVVVEEAHRDALIITQHPVEKGTAITDHAFAAPATVVIRCGFSNASAGSAGYVQRVYQEFIAWKKSREPRDVFTGKRRYRNMLPADIAVATDGRSENSLFVIVACQEVIITSTQRAGTGTDTTKAGEGSGGQADPANTGSTNNLGPQQGINEQGYDFAGSFSPGLTNPEGGTVGNGSFDLSMGPGSGFSPSEVTGDVGPITVQDGSGNIIFDDSGGVNLSNAMNPGATGIF